MTTHIQDLRQVLGKLQAAGLILRGSFGTDKITHLGFEYSDTGVAPSPQKTKKAISDWPTLLHQRSPLIFRACKFLPLLCPPLYEQSHHIHMGTQTPGSLHDHTRKPS